MLFIIRLRLRSHLFPFNQRLLCHTNSEVVDGGLHWAQVAYRVSHQLLAAIYNQTLPHRDEAMAETREYHRNVAWIQVSWDSQNGTEPSFPVRTKSSASECLIIAMIRQVTCISRHHFLFLPGSCFQQNSCTTGKAKEPSVPCLISCHTGIIRTYRSSATYWCKFGVHALCCSRDRAVFHASMWENSLS